MPQGRKRLGKGRGNLPVTAQGGLGTQAAHQAKKRKGKKGSIPVPTDLRGGSVSKTRHRGPVKAGLYQKKGKPKPGGSPVQNATLALLTRSGDVGGPKKKRKMKGPY